MYKKLGDLFVHFKNIKEERGGVEKSEVDQLRVEKVF